LKDVKDKKIKIDKLSLRALASVGAMAIGREDLAVKLMKNDIKITKDCPVN
jgi:hypothetical protein